MEICHHIGALALHSGFKTPLFSYLPHKRTVDSDGSTDSNGDAGRREMEFVGIKMEKCDDYDADTNVTEQVRLLTSDTVTKELLSLRIVS